MLCKEIDRGMGFRFSLKPIFFYVYFFERWGRRSIGHIVIIALLTILFY